MFELLLIILFIIIKEYLLGNSYMYRRQKPLSNLNEANRAQAWHFDCANTCFYRHTGGITLWNNDRAMVKASFAKLDITDNTELSP